ncbi:MAG TPA: oxygenase MpaB family protein, partial [Acidimicrobiales bacterium]
YFREMRPLLEVGDQTLDAVRFLTTPGHDSVNPLLSGAHQVVVQASVGLLPAWAREMLGLRHPTLVDWARVLPATHLLMGALRFAGGPPLGLVQARRRCAAEPLPPRPEAARTRAAPARAAVGADDNASTA